ncbi:MULTISPECIES: albusnodin family lasso peptide [unclassified Crossiella]|nr:MULTISPECIES: albusnodin family lasso peptide [unclassified Crossiella]MCK2239372.1 albusnodin family lasso peptide [Crossiella sp. S99.2]MCK2252067.1 albusnodin family lasso peptide [Crossiella sp. S99.1]
MDTHSTEPQRPPNEQAAPTVLLIDLGDVADLTLGGQPQSGPEDKRYFYQ